MTKYLHPTVCAVLAFMIGVAIARVTIADRERPQKSPPNSSHKIEPLQQAATPRRVWPEPRQLDELELIEAKRLEYAGYLIRRREKTVKLDWYGKGQKTAFPASYATLTRNGKLLTTFDSELYHPLGNQISFGLLSLLGTKTKQLVVMQSIQRGGSHWIVNLAPRFQVVHFGGEWGLGREYISSVDLEQDGVEEILQCVTVFYQLQDKLPISQIPLPTVIFKYDAKAAKYFPANTLHKDYLLHEIEEETKKVSKPSDNFGHLGDVLDITLQYVYAGQEKEGWEFYNRTYQLPDKEEIRTRVLSLLKDEPVYQFIYKKDQIKQRAPVILPDGMKSMLDQRFPNWHYLPVDDTIRKFLKEYVSEYARPDLIQGDFDGNGHPDFAVLIDNSQNRNAVASGRSGSQTSSPKLIVFLTKATTIEMKILEPDGEYLTLMNRNVWDYDYETGQYFTYQNDAIFAGIFEKGGTSYVYKKGKFTRIVTSD